MQEKVRCHKLHETFFYTKGEVVANKTTHFEANTPHPYHTSSPQYRFIDAMLVQRELKAGKSDLAKRVAPEDAARLVRDRLFLLKNCIISGKDTPSEPFLYHLH